MRKLLLCILACVCVLQLLAQQKTITGKVTDENGNAVAGASVVIRGSTRGVVTRPDGSFLITVPDNVTSLTVSSVGFEAQNVTITGATLDVKLKASTNPLDEVVVVGYTQTRKKKDEAGAISTIRAKELENLPNLSIDKAMQGKAAGVLVQANNGIPGGNMNVRIRGGNSIQNGVEPLYVVDGVQMNTAGSAAFSESNPLSFLNPDDIESIDIIKDAATSSIYGARAANGVVLITTKKGRAGKTRFTANVYAGVVSPLKYLNVVDGQEYFQLRAEAYGFANNLPATDIAIKRVVLNELRVPGASTFTNAQADSAIGLLPTYDWQRAAIGNGTLSNYEISASGGNERSTFRLSASLTKQSTIVTKADFKRYGLKADIMNKPNDRLTFATTLSMSSFEQNVPFAVSGSFLGSPAFAGAGIIPTNPIYNSDGTYYGVPGGTPANIAGTLNQNIIQVNDYNSGFQRTNQLVGNVNVDYKITSWLSIKGFAGLDYRLLHGKRVSDARTADAFVRKGLVQLETDYNTNVTTFATLNFNRTFADKHGVDGFIGYEYRQENSVATSETGDGFPTYQFISLANAANPLTVNETFTGYRTNALFGSVNYNFDGKYIIGLVGRYDGSSRFIKGEPYGLFYGIKTAWNIDREKFLENSNVISSLRIRLNYGSVGNDQIGNFDGLGLYGGGGVYNGAAAIAFTQLENPNLTWETTKEFNLGTDFGFWKNRLTGTVELYSKKTVDVLLNQPLQQTTGFATIARNIGELENKGIEVTLNGDIVRGKTSRDFSLTGGITFAYNDQKVTELYGGLKVLPADNSIQVGQPVGVLFTQKYAGVNPATGRPMWYDSLGNLTYAVLARDRVLIGPQRLAPFIGGGRASVKYKGFTLDVFFQGEWGRWSSDGQINFLFENIARINELQYIYDNRWTTPGQVTSVPRFNVNGTEQKGSGAQSGNRMFFRADYIRLKNVLLSYDIPASIAAKAKLSSARFYVQGTNLVTWSDWYSYDIEFIQGAGNNVGIIPQTRNITVGLQLGF